MDGASFGERVEAARGQFWGIGELTRLKAVRGKRPELYCLRLRNGRTLAVRRRTRSLFSRGTRQITSLVGSFGFGDNARYSGFIAPASSRLRQERPGATAPGHQPSSASSLRPLWAARRDSSPAFDNNSIQHGECQVRRQEKRKNHWDDHVVSGPALLFASPSSHPLLGFARLSRRLSGGFARRNAL